MQLSYNPAAVWISHSALEEFYRCPKSYYFRYLYTNSAGLRVTIAEPNLTLGVLVDEVIKDFFSKSVKPDLNEMLRNLEFKWKLKTGKSGGFRSESQEAFYKEAAVKMLTNFLTNFPALKMEAEVPEFLQMSLMPEGDVRLCGTPDLIEHLPDGTIHVIDLKTSEREKTEPDLQLPIYTILIEEETGKTVSKTSYWYLKLFPGPNEVPFKHDQLPKALEDIKFKTEAILKSRLSNDFKCLKGEGGCYKCQDFEFIKNETAEIVGKDKKRVVYFVNKDTHAPKVDTLYSDDLPF